MAAIGIDLGTTNSCVAIVKKDGKTIDVLSNKMSKRTTPSIVGFCENMLFGENARNKIEKNEENVVYGFKYLMGRKFKDKSVQDFIKKCTYNVIEKGDMLIPIDWKDESKLYRPEEISAFLLMHLKSESEKYFGEEVEKAVITVPTYFTEKSRQATLAAGHMAGFKIVELLNEPTAAALAYQFENSLDDTTVLVFDFGGGTFDTTILKLSKDNCTVLAIDGDLNLGGENIDDNVVNHLMEHLREKGAKDITNHKRKMFRLKNLAEKAKIDLACEENTDIEITSVVGGDDYEYDLTLTLEKFNEINDAIFKKCIDIVNKCIARAGLDNSKIDRVLLVGGSSKNAAMYNYLKQNFGKIYENLNPDEVVAKGAAVMAYKMKEFSVNQILAHSIGKLNCRKEFVPFISKFSKYPIKVTKPWRTAPKGNTKLRITLRTEASADILGRLYVANIHPSADGEHRVQISLEVDENGILNVTADDGHDVASKLSVDLQKGTLTSEQLNVLTKANEKLYIAYKKK